jgi:hypothetical protein
VGIQLGRGAPLFYAGRPPRLDQVRRFAVGLSSATEEVFPAGQRWGRWRTERQTCGFLCGGAFESRARLVIQRAHRGYPICTIALMLLLMLLVNCAAVVSCSRPSLHFPFNADDIAKSYCPNGHYPPSPDESSQIFRTIISYCRSRPDGPVVAFD